MQTELETTGDEVKTNTAERIRIAEWISRVKRDLDILSEKLASNTEGRTLTAVLRAAKYRLEEVNNDLVSLIVENKNESVKLQRVVDGKAPMTMNLDMGGYRILNVAHPRDPRKYESDLVTSKILYMSQVDQNYMGKDKDGSLDGRLDMSMSDLADPTDADDAVTRRYVASRFQSLIDEVQDDKCKLDALQNFLGVENNQVLIREYVIIDTDFSLLDTYIFFQIFTLKEYFIHLLEEPVDDTTWLRIKQPVTYTIHFDLIPIDPSSFSFDLHTRDEIINFSEHNTKHDINLEKNENCVLLFELISQIIRIGSKIYVYYKI